MRYRFSLGDSNKGAVGICLDVRAETQEAAIERVKELFGENEGGIPIDLDGTEHARVYLNGNAAEISAAAIVDEDEPEEPAEPDDSAEDDE